MIKLAQAAKAAQASIISKTTMEKNKLLGVIADMLEENTEEIINANKLDIENAKKNNIKESLIDRLMLNEARIKDMAEAVRKLISLDDPVGKIISGVSRPNGLVIEKTRVPIGVVGIIYEARPNVTIDGAALCLKSSNVVILRGGKEAINSNISLVGIVKKALLQEGFSTDCVNLVTDTSRESANQMMTLSGYLDVLIPRGGASLIKAVVENSKVPVIETGSGNCHVFINYDADFEMAVNITDNAKTSRPSVCNAAETLLVHKFIASEILPDIKEKLDEHNVILYGDEKTLEILPGIERATEEDFYTEYNDYKMTVKIVEDVDEAINHINKYGTRHSECIITNSYEDTQKFLNLVDAAAVYVNASTRFTDGGEFGLGAEIGISTGKLHARGPMGLDELTTIKYQIRGQGQIR